MEESQLFLLQIEEGIRTLIKDVNQTTSDRVRVSNVVDIITQLDPIQSEGELMKLLCGCVPDGISTSESRENSLNPIIDNFENFITAMRVSSAWIRKTKTLTEESLFNVLDVISSSSQADEEPSPPV